MCGRTISRSKEVEKANLKYFTTMLFKTTDTSNKGHKNFESSVEQLCNACIESKYTKIVRHKKLI